MTQHTEKRITSWETGDFVPFSSRILLPSTTADFPVYLRRGDKFVLYTRSGEGFGENHRTMLMDGGHEHVFIEAARKEDYDAYLQANITRILTDDSIPPEERAATWSGTVCCVARSFFKLHLPAAHLQKLTAKMEAMIAQTARFMADPNALKAMAQFITRGNESYHHGVGTMVYASCILHACDANELLLVTSGLGAILHDIGRQRLPREICEKDPATHTESEHTIFASHPAIGVQMCTPFPLVPEAVQCVMLHHERMDGQGFPAGAMGRDIPLQARAVALANTYDTLIRPQPWRRGNTPFQALKVIRDDPAGYDQVLFRRFVALLADAKLTPEL